MENTIYSSFSCNFTVEKPDNLVDTLKWEGIGLLHCKSDLNEDAGILHVLSHMQMIRWFSCHWQWFLCSFKVSASLFFFNNKLCLNINNATTVLRSCVNEKSWKWLLLMQTEVSVVKKNCSGLFQKYLFEVWVHVSVLLEATCFRISEWFESMSAKLFFSHVNTWFAPSTFPYRFR